jgi:predicted MFS family arabinose efflux permease
MIAGDLIRGIALASIPVAAIFDVLTIGHVVAVALVIGVNSVFFEIAGQTYLPSIVETRHLLSSNSRLQSGQAAAQTAGPAVGGALVQLLSAPVALVADVFSYFLSALLLYRVRAREIRHERVTEQRMLPQLREGFGYVFRDPIIRSLAMAATSINLLCAAFDVLLVPFLLRTVHISPASVGIVIAVGGAGGVLGASIGSPLADRIGSCRTLLAAAVCGPLLGLLVPLGAPGAGMVLFGAGLVSHELSISIVSLMARTYRQVAVPRELLARVTATIKFLSWGILPIGAVAGGALGRGAGNRPALWVVCVLFLLTPLPIVLSPIRARKDLLEPADAKSPAVELTPAEDAATPGALTSTTRRPD